MDAQVTLLLPSCEPPAVLRATLEALALTLGDLPVHLHVETDPGRTGVGATLRRGLLTIRTPWVLFVMADGSEAPDDMRRTVQACLDAPTVCAVFGTRWSRGGSVVGYPPWKRRLNRLGNRFLARCLAGQQRYDDWTDLAKAYRTEGLRAIHWDDDFACAVQIPLRYLRWAHWRPVVILSRRWVERTQGRSRYTLRQALRTAWAAWKETR